MQTFWSETQLSHTGARFFQRGRLVASPEKSERGTVIRSELKKAGHEIVVPEDFGIKPILAVHEVNYIEFLKSAYENWTDSFGDDSSVIPNILGNAPSHSELTSVVGKLGIHTGDLACEITQGTWPASYASAQCAANAAAFTLRTEKPSYGLCRPPGHHASASKAMGFCYLNNAAVAAQTLRERYQRVAILDVDVHHGNGTQSIFYKRGDIFTASMHSNPTDFYPFYYGYESETGEGDGLGFNLNVCYKKGAGDMEFLGAFSKLSETLRETGSDAIVVALGVDALHTDPHGEHNVSPGAFGELARRVRSLGFPTVIVQEGGYLSPELASTIVLFLAEFEKD